MSDNHALLRVVMLSDGAVEQSLPRAMQLAEALELILADRFPRDDGTTPPAGGPVPQDYAELAGTAFALRLCLPSIATGEAAAAVARIRWVVSQVENRLGTGNLESQPIGSETEVEIEGFGVVPEQWLRSLKWAISRVKTAIPAQETAPLQPAGVTEIRRESPDDPISPPDLLHGWEEIEKALEMPTNTRNRRKIRDRIRRYQKDHNGPIAINRRGCHPVVERAALLKWWSLVCKRATEQAQDRDNVVESVSGRYFHGRSGTECVPEISGAVKTRKKAAK